MANSLPHVTYCLLLVYKLTVLYVYLQDNRVHIGPKIEMRVVILGLDDAGKTSLLFKMKNNEFITTIPTIGKFIWQTYNLQKNNWQT